MLSGTCVPEPREPGGAECVAHQRLRGGGGVALPAVIGSDAVGALPEPGRVWGALVAPAPAAGGAGTRHNGEAQRLGRGPGRSAHPH
jgi:hypothetical protein